MKRCWVHSYGQNALARAGHWPRVMIMTLVLASQFSPPAPALGVLSPVEIILEEGVNGYTGARDNTIYAESTNTNGGGQNIFCGNTNNGFARRTLLAFDFSGIPAGSTILAATLQLTVAQSSSGPVPAHLHRLTSDWGEGTQAGLGTESGGAPPVDGDATWVSSFHNVSLWSAPGGDYALIPSATASIAGVGAAATWLSVQMAADVQNWLDGPQSNYGWILIGDESVNQTTKRIHSSDNTTVPAGQRPRLTVLYQPPVTVVNQSSWVLY